MFEARLDAVRRSGGNPFRDEQLPQAVIALKQGAGRLIRTIDDRGVLVLCDPRLTSRPYGRVFLGSLPPRLLLAGGELLVTHAGDVLTDDEALRAEFNVNSAKTGVVDRYGVKELVDWVADYAGEHFVVYGHQTVLEPLRRARTLNLDTGCVYGGRLTALRFPEMELVSVPAHQAYATAKRWEALQDARREGTRP